MAKGYIDNGNIIGVLFLDLAKAFDLLCHEILIKKLEKYKLSCECLNWLESYLHNRTQIVHC